MSRAKKVLDKIPGFSRGVRETTGLRMIKMCRPICPNSRIEMEQDVAGNWRQVDKGPDFQNCQMEGGRWWLGCIERGHEPYWTINVWYTKKDVTEELKDEQGNGTGEFEVVKTVRVRHETRRPNLAQVAVAKNINSGRGPDDAIKRKGFRYLASLGFEECCQFRNCQKEVDPKYVIDGLGRYCSLKHLELVVMTHAQDDGAPAIRLVDAGFHKDATRKQQMKKRKEFKEAMSDAEEVYS